MPKHLGALTLLLVAAMVIIRIRLMKKQGIDAFQFGKIDKTDFIIPPFVLFYFYTIFANAFDLPLVSTQELFPIMSIRWAGVFICFAGLLLFLWSILSFGQSFRVGIDPDTPNKLITTGVFTYTRNPIYVAFISILLAQFLIFSNPVPLIYLLAAAWLINRQILREEDFLKEHYGEAYTEYCKRVRRYF